VTSSIFSAGTPSSILMTLRCRANVTIIVCTAALAGMVLFIYATKLLTVGFPASLDYNEGWNAYFGARLERGSELYARPDEFVWNNYPPLYHVLQAAVLSLDADPIIFGRWLSLASIAFIALLLGTLAHQRRGDYFASALITLGFLVHVYVLHPAYVGKNDPQWLAQAFSAAGLFVLLRLGPMPAALWAASGLFVVALSLKHNVIAAPLAVTLWLLIHHRAAFARWLIAGLVWAGLAGALWIALFSPRLLVAVFGHHRAMNSPAALVKTYADVLGHYFLLFAAMALVGLDRKRRWTEDLALLYALFGLIFGILFLAGAGVSLNVLFEAQVGIWFVLAQNAARLDAAAWARREVTAWVLAATLLLGGLLYFAGAPATVAEARRLADEQAFDVARLARSSGPVACEILALCFWAGKSFELDFFNAGQEALVDSVYEQRLVDRFDNQYFAVVQREPDSDRLTPAVTEALLRSYHVGWRGTDAEFWVPGRILEPSYCRCPGDLPPLQQRVSRGAK
jgi:hypothetical protein